MKGRARRREPSQNEHVFERAHRLKVRAFINPSSLTDAQGHPRVSAHREELVCAGENDSRNGLGLHTLFNTLPCVMHRRHARKHWHNLNSKLAMIIERVRAEVTPSAYRRSALSISRAMKIGPARRK